MLQTVGYAAVVGFAVYGAIECCRRGKNTGLAKKVKEVAKDIDIGTHLAKLASGKVNAFDAKIVKESAGKQLFSTVDGYFAISQENRTGKAPQELCSDHFKQGTSVTWSQNDDATEAYVGLRVEVIDADTNASDIGVITLIATDKIQLGTKGHLPTDSSIIVADERANPNLGVCKKHRQAGGYTDLLKDIFGEKDLKNNLSTLLKNQAVVLGKKSVKLSPAA